MKIVKIEPLLVGAPTPGCGLLSNRNYFYILLHTDEGITGLGEATLESHDESILGCLRDLEDLILGQDPAQVGRLMQTLIRQRFWKGGVVKASAVSGVELACWDIIGKAAGKPVYELFGGALRDRVRVYANGWSGGSTDPGVIREKAAEAKEYGYRAFKFSLAIPGWPVRDLGTVRQIRKAAETVREAVGEECEILFDGHGRYDSSLAIQVGKALEEFKPLFFEEPVQPEDEEGMARVADKVDIPIAAGERLTRLQEFRRLFEKRAICVAQPDLAHCHGFNEGVKVAHMAEAFDGFVAPHCPMSPVITAISLHLDAIAPNFLIQERLFLNDWRNEVITKPLAVKDGYLELLSGPGWGIELDMELIRKHPRIAAGTPRLFRPDGAVCDW